MVVRDFFDGQLREKRKSDGVVCSREWRKTKESNWREFEGKVPRDLVTCAKYKVVDGKAVRVNGG